MFPSPVAREPRQPVVGDRLEADALEQIAEGQVIERLVFEIR
jgi:hypothetical protein